MVFFYLILHNQEEDYDELNKKIPNTIREYMNKNKLADRKLFSFSKQGQFKPYSTNCGAVDSRQPQLQLILILKI